MKNNLKYLVIHCLATPEGKAFTSKDVIRWHTSPVSEKGRGWSRPGYSDMVYLDGSLVNLVPYNSDDIVDPWELTNGVKGLNALSRHIAYVGGCDSSGKPKDTRTPAQKQTLENLVRKTIQQHPHIQVLGHNQAPSGVGKACPSFDVPSWLRSIGVKEENIYKSIHRGPSGIVKP